MSALLKKGTGEKDTVVSLNIRVGVTLPADFDPRAMPNETSLAGARGYKEISGHVIDSVAQALPPPDHPVCLGTDVMRKIGMDVGMKVIEIEGPRAGVRENTEVVADREQGIEGSEIIVVWIAVAARYIGTKADTRPRG